MKRGRKPKVLKSKLSEGDTGAGEKEIEGRKENGVSHKVENLMNKDGVSGVGEQSGEKEKKTEGKGRIKFNLKESLDFVDENAKENGEYTAVDENAKENSEYNAVDENAKENGEYTEQKRESEVLKGDRKVKFDENCQVMGEDTDVVSEKIMVPNEFISWSRKRKKVNYNEDGVDGDDEGIFGKKRRKRRRGLKVIQKRKILTAEKGQEKDGSDKEENKGVNKKKRSRKGKNNEKDSETDGLKSKGREEDDKGEVNNEKASETDGLKSKGGEKDGKGEVNNKKVSETEGLKSKGGEEDDKSEVKKGRRRGPKKRGKIGKEESTSDLGHVEEEKVSSQSNDRCRYTLRPSKNQKEQKEESKDTKKNMHFKARNFSVLL